MMNLEGSQLFPYPNAFLNGIVLVGLLSVLKFFTVTTWNVAMGLRAHVWSKLRNKNFVETYGQWAGKVRQKTVFRTRNCIAHDFKLTFNFKVSFLLITFAVRNIYTLILD